jgi:hypothetical protein
MLLLKVIGIIGFAQTLIMCGIYFISGHFLPAYLAPVYAVTGYTARLLLALLVAFSTGNLLMAYAYGQYPPQLAAPVTIVAIVVLQVVFAVMCFGLKPSPWIYAATLAAAASCFWVSLLLTAPKAP